VAGVFTVVFPNHEVPLTGEVASSTSLPDVDVLPILEMGGLLELDGEE